MKSLISILMLLAIACTSFGGSEPEIQENAPTVEAITLEYNQDIADPLAVAVSNEKAQEVNTLAKLVGEETAEVEELPEFPNIPAKGDGVSAWLSWAVALVGWLWALWQYFVKKKEKKS